MSLHFCVLGSGSGGNATLLRIVEGEDIHHILLDAGFSPRELRRRLATLELGFEDIDALLLTHMHSDHFRAAMHEVCKQQQWRILMHQRHGRLWRKKTGSRLLVEAFDGPFALTATTQVTPISLPHDQQSSTGMLFEHEDIRFGFLTDLGHVPPAVYQQFRGMDALAIESNYDPQLQQSSPRPAFLKRRIMGRLGHLSNAQSVQAVSRLAAHSGLGRIVLLHLSEQCNDPDIVHALYQEQAPHLLERMTCAHQRIPTALFEVVPTAIDPSQQSAALAPEPSSSPQLELF